MYTYLIDSLAGMVQNIITDRALMNGNLYRYGKERPLTVLSDNRLWQYTSYNYITGMKNPRMVKCVPYN
jgi:hypothetical protein